MNCTYEGCDKPATTPQVATDGEQWANLCDEHATEVDSAVAALDAKRVLRSWVKAQGGAKAATSRMMAGMRKSQKKSQ